MENKSKNVKNKKNTVINGSGMKVKNLKIKERKRKKTNQEIIKNRKITYLVLLLAAFGLFILVLNMSYAFFTSRVTSKDYIIYTGNLEIDYTEIGSLINLENTYPMTNAEGLQTSGYSFSITNNGSIDTKYQIRLELDQNTTIPIEYIKLACFKTQENSEQVSEEIGPVLLSNLNELQTFISNQVIEPGKIDSYTLKMWIDYSAPIDIKGKIFKAKIVIDSLQNVDDGYIIDNNIQQG